MDTGPGLAHAFGGGAGADHAQFVVFVVSDLSGNLGPSVGTKLVD